MNAQSDYEWMQERGLSIDIDTFGERVSIILEDFVLNTPDEMLENARQQAAMELLQ